ncbi:MAG: molybdopterin molybdotransferase MoeA [Desulfobacterales bacterium]|nr:molybdopterin molybdotransferase MoeA [Desulfobacterales bacterium]
MHSFFNVTDPKEVLGYRTEFPPVAAEKVSLFDAAGRILAVDIVSDLDLPDFVRSTMDGYAVCGASTFGASEANPAYLTVKGSVTMGKKPDILIRAGEAVRIPTGGMLPAGADSVVMIEHSAAIDDTTIEVYRSVAPGTHIVAIGEDIGKGEILLSRGQKIRPQETGLLAALGKKKVCVYRKPRIGIISTGDEIIPINETPNMSQIRDINTYTLSGLVKETGGIPLIFGIVRDEFETLLAKCLSAIEQSDMVLISGGSSVGLHDFTIKVLSCLPATTILVHGIAISPGKPTILAKTQKKAFWGLPGHAASAMVVFTSIVKPFIEQISGLKKRYKKEFRPTALLMRNLSSAQGRIDYIRVRLIQKDGVYWAEPILGKSGLIRTMVEADGLIKIDIHTEGLEKGTEVEIIPL